MDRKASGQRKEARESEWTDVVLGHAGQEMVNDTWDRARCATHKVNAMTSPTAAVTTEGTNVREPLLPTRTSICLAEAAAAETRRAMTGEKRMIVEVNERM